MSPWYTLLFADIVILYYHVSQWSDFSPPARLVAVGVWVYLALLHLRLIRRRKSG